MTRKEQIERRAQDVQSMGFIQAFIEGAEWADKNPNHDYYQEYALEKINKLSVIESQLAIALKALERIADDSSFSLRAKDLVYEADAALAKIKDMK